MKQVGHASYLPTVSKWDTLHTSLQSASGTRFIPPYSRQVFINPYSQQVFINPYSQQAGHASYLPTVSKWDTLHTSLQSASGTRFIPPYSQQEGHASYLPTVSKWDTLHTSLQSASGTRITYWSWPDYKTLECPVSVVQGSHQIPVSSSNRTTKNAFQIQQSFLHCKLFIQKLFPAKLIHVFRSSRK
jgi:hypothetical protein